MRGTNRIYRVIAVAVLALGCSDSPTEPSSSERSGPGTPEPVLRLVVAPAAAIIRAGETLQLNATAASDDRLVVRQIAVSWLSSDSEIATVSSDGLLRGIRPGRAEIKVRWGTSSATVQVTVLKGDPQPVACLSLIPKDGC
jgi:hypothetical protein